MIPILYDKDEMLFASNGLGRLRDCMSCKVTEERNGIYECDFEYPVSGAHFDEIICGRIIGVTHENSDDVQPFDIVSASKPINGVVTFHAVHISYRQSKIVAYATNVNSLLAAFTLFQTFGEPTNPFTYGSDMATVSETRYIAAFDGEPRSVRALLGGVEGSILDAYGGEYEWDKFRIYLHSARGQYRDYTIRYGVNLLDYNEDVDYSETYSSIIPYWKGTDQNGATLFVIGDRQEYSQPTNTGRDETVAVDLTDKFESQPTKSQVETMGQAFLMEHQPTLPQQNIKIDFIQIEESEEYQQYANLLQCKLCDTVRVIFPMYNMIGNFKIVKTVWNVLLDRYDEIELGTLSTTLSEALGISNGLGATSEGVTPFEPDDYVIDKGTSGIWRYRKWASGIAECWAMVSGSWTVDFSTAQTTGVYSNDTWKSKAESLPSGLFTSVESASGSVQTNGYTEFQISSLSTTALAFRVWNPYATNSMTIYSYTLSVKGKW